MERGEEREKVRESERTGDTVRWRERERVCVCLYIYMHMYKPQNATLRTRRFEFIFFRKPRWLQNPLYGLPDLDPRIELGSGFGVWGLGFGV